MDGRARRVSLLLVAVSAVVAHTSPLSAQAPVFNGTFVEHRVTWQNPQCSGSTPKAPATLTSASATVPMGHGDFGANCGASNLTGQLSLVFPATTPTASWDVSNGQVVLSSPMTTSLALTGNWSRTFSGTQRYNARADAFTSTQPNSGSQKICRAPGDSKSDLPPMGSTGLSASASCSWEFIGNLTTGPTQIGVVPDLFVRFTTSAEIRLSDSFFNSYGNVLAFVETVYKFSPQGSDDSPKVTSLDAKVATKGSKFRITIMGEKFAADAVPEFLRGSSVDNKLTVSNVVVTPPNRIQAELSIDPFAELGARALRVRSAGKDSPTLSNALHVFLGRMAVNQAGANFGSNVANHPTTIQFMAEAEIPLATMIGNNKGMSALLYIFDSAGNQVPGSPVSPNAPAPTKGPKGEELLRNTYDFKPNYSSYSAEEHYFLRDALNFYLLEQYGNMLPAGEYSFVIAFSPYDPTIAPAPIAGIKLADLLARRDQITDTDNRAREFETTRPLRILLVADGRIKAPGIVKQLRSGVQRATEFIKAAYPVDNTKVSVKLVFDPFEVLVPVRQLQPDPVTQFLVNWGRRVNFHLSSVLAIENRAALRNGQPPFDQIALITDFNSAIPLTDGGTGLSNRTGAAIVTFENPGTLAHEIGHSFGFGETYCGPTCGDDDNFTTCVYEAVNCRRSDAITRGGDDSGNRVDEGHVRLFPMFNTFTPSLGASASSVRNDGNVPSLNAVFYQRVSLMGKSNDENNRWIDGIEWSHLRRQLSASSFKEVQLHAIEERLIVYGTIDVSDKVGDIRMIRQMAEPPAGTQSGDLVAEILDGNGSVLGGTPFRVSFVQSDVGLTSGADFIVNVPYRSQARQFRIRKGTRTLHTQPLSAGVPTAQITEPVAGAQLSGTTTIRWSGSDPDGDTLRYSLFYVPPGGGTPLPIAFDVTGTSFEWNTLSYPGGSGGRVDLWVSDGINDASAQSGALTLGKKGPEVLIASPVDGTAFPAGSQIVFSGSANDAEDGAIAPATLSFRSSLDGQLGTGSMISRTLSEGRHTITLRAVDRDGFASEDVVIITVGAANTVPVIESLTPALVQQGADVTITGRNFDPAAAQVRIADLSATTRSITATSIVAVVPLDAPRGKVTVRVVQRDLTSSDGSVSVTASRPVIVAIAPASAPAGTTVSIRGAAFSATASQNSVFFGSTAARILSASDSELVVTVPAIAQGTTNVSVQSPRGTSGARLFTVLGGDPPGPAITAISPPSAGPGSEVSIQGRGFSSDPTRNLIRFGSTTVSATSTSDSSLRLLVPPLADGVVPVNVTIDGFPSNTVNFTVQAVQPGPDGERQIIPVVGSVAGSLGSFFRTAVQLHNPGSTTISGRFVYHVRDRSGLPTDPSLPYSLVPGQTRFIPDLLPALSQSGLGSADLIVTAGSKAPLTVVRIFNDAGAKGTAGMTEEKFREQDVLTAGQSGVIIGPSNPDRFRLNIGIRTLGSGATFTVTLTDELGFEIESVTRSYPPSYFVQVPVTSLFEASLFFNDTFTFRMDAGSAIIYGATTDNLTQDSSLQFARPLRLADETGSQLVLPVAGSTPGSFGSFFKTELQLHNPSDEVSSVFVTYHPQQTPGSSNDIGGAIHLAPRETFYIGDFLPLFGLGGLGTFDVEVLSGVIPVAIVRIFNDAGTAGTTGMTEELVRVEDALHAGQRGVLLAPATPESARFNIGIRTLGAGATIRMTVRDQSGAVKKTLTRTYAAIYFQQFSAPVLLETPLAASDSIAFEVVAGDAIIYGATTDNITQDPSLQFARRIE